MRRRVLVIEDSPDFLVVLRDFLSRDYDVVTTLERSEVERLIPTVDLVICDYHFSPTLSFESVVEIVDDRVPVILCSGDPPIDYPNRVDKPEVILRMRQTIERLLEKDSTNYGLVGD